MLFYFALGELPLRGVDPGLLTKPSFSLSDPRHTVRTIFGDEVAEKITPAWGVDEEGEVSGVWADSGIEGLYQMMGECTFVFVFVSNDNS